MSRWNRIKQWVADACNRFCICVGMYIYQCVCAQMTIECWVSYDDKCANIERKQENKRNEFFSQGVQSQC